MGWEKAVRTGVRFHAAVTGPSGSGKTYGALRLARGIVGPDGKIGLIDTENKRAKYYADMFDFTHVTMEPPFEVEKYIDLMREAYSMFDALIIDSISHAWASEGGLLEQKAEADKRGGNQYVNWGDITEQQNLFVSEILGTKIDLICTIRSKEAHAMEQKDGGGFKIVNKGLQPIQRPGMRYEFDMVFDIEMDHKATMSKETTGLFPGSKPFQITEEVGEKMAEWRNSAPKQETLSDLEKGKILPKELREAFVRSELDTEKKILFCKKHGGDGRVWDHQTITTALKAEMPGAFQEETNGTN